jgi:pathogenesis-related protein 1
MSPPLLRVTATALALLLASCTGEIGGGDDDDDNDTDDDDDDSATTDAGDPDVDGGNPAEGEPAALAGITAAHNEVRAAHGVGPMSWNAALAATAQAWADGCTDDEAPVGLIDHNAGRSDGHPYYVGENVYGSSGGASGPGAVELWASEESDYDYDANTCSGVCGHYTQVVWATSVDLGCGISTCPDLTYGTSIVCNYGPGGNNGSRPY